MDNTHKPVGDVCLDCDAGRSMGCATYCCRLIVRLQPDERPPAPPGEMQKGCVPKTPSDGLCEHLDRATSRCGVWEFRPAVCRAYDCNHDPLLQVVLQDGFQGLVKLVTSTTQVAPAARRQVPYRPKEV